VSTGSEWLPGMTPEMVAERDRRIAVHERAQERAEEPTLVPIERLDESYEAGFEAGYAKAMEARLA